MQTDMSAKRERCEVDVIRSNGYLDSLGELKCVYSAGDLSNVEAVDDLILAMVDHEWCRERNIGITTDAGGCL